jgi:hypothetical protein
MAFSRVSLLTVCGALAVLAAEAPLPELRIEPKAGGSDMFVRNPAAQPLTAYLIELVDYPGSSYSYFQDDPAETISAGAVHKIPTTNMTIGAAPEYVKITAAIYADGSTVGVPGRIEVLVGRRRTVLETTRELIRRIEKAGGASAARADLAQWSDSLPAPTRANRNQAAGINAAAARALVSAAAAQLAAGDTAPVLERLHASERSLAALKP